MTEIVIAYAPPDVSAADRVIAKLEALGFNVKRDEAGKRRTARRTPVTPGRNTAEPMIVLWSRHYALARLRGAAGPRSALMAARLDAAPLSFLMKSPAIDLRAWRGREDHRGWRALVAGLGAGAKPVSKAAPKRAPAPMKSANVKATAKIEKEKKKGGAAVLLWIAGAAAAAGGAAAFFVMH